MVQVRVPNAYGDYTLFANEDFKIILIFKHGTLFNFGYLLWIDKRKELGFWVLKQF